MSDSSKHDVSPARDECDMEDDKEVIDEEEALFIALEERKAAEEAIEAAHPNSIPIDVTSAPKLLQDALKSGSIEENESSGLAKIDVEDDTKENGTRSTDDNEEKKNDEIEVKPVGTFLQKVSQRPPS
jgi:hypothetical protein